MSLTLLQASIVSKDWSPPPVFFSLYIISIVYFLNIRFGLVVYINLFMLLMWWWYKSGPQPLGYPPGPPPPNYPHPPGPPQPPPRPGYQDYFYDGYPPPPPTHAPQPYHHHRHHDSFLGAWYICVLYPY